MKIAVFEDVRKVRIKDIPTPEVWENQVLIKIEACAICTWEQRVYSGVKVVPFPFVGGHELTGEIVYIGSRVDSRILNVGDKVVYGTNLACGLCYQCKTGNEQNCEYFDHTQKLEGTPFRGLGGFSEYLLAESNRVFKIHNIQKEIATLIEPVSCCVHSIESAQIEFGEIVMVVGCGIMGLIHVQLAVKKGCVVIAIDMNDDRLEQARKFGAHRTINNSKCDLNNEINKVTKKLGVNAIFNTVFSSDVAQEMQQYLAINGRHVLYSSFYPDTPVSISPDTLHKKATRIIGTANSNSRDFIRSISLVENEIIDLKPFVGKIYDFEDIEDALEMSLTQKYYRVVINF